MFDKDTNKIINDLEKTAAISDSSTGEAQLKKKTQVTQSDNEGKGMALGSLIGAGSGALSKKYKAIATAVGGLGGALLGKQIGKRTINTKRVTTNEKAIKKQQKRPEGAEVPRLTDEKVLKLLKSNK